MELDWTQPVRSHLAGACWDGCTRQRQEARSSLAVGDVTATVESPKALTSLSDDDLATTGPKALTSLSDDLATPTATAQKALTSLAVAARDILSRFRSFG